MCGDHVTVLKVDKMAKSICVSNVVPLREPCSGISLADNGRFFHSLTHRGKLFVKFKVPGDQERVSKLAPLSKSPTAHKMDCNVMVKCKGGSSVAIGGRDGLFSLTPLTDSPATAAKDDEDGGGGGSGQQISHLFHYDTGMVTMFLCILPFQQKTVRVV